MREAEKKSSSTNDYGPLRGGWGKGRAIKKKEIFEYRNKKSKKNLFTNFRYKKIYMSSGTLWDPPINKMKNFTYEVLGIKIR